MSAKTLAKIGTNFGIQIISHIPCCGPQVLLFTGAAFFIGQTAADILYKSQFILPLFISIFFTWGPMARWFQGHRHSGSCSHACGHTHKSKARIYFDDLKLGYGITIILYLIVPPHNHNPVFGHVNGWANETTTMVSKDDPTKTWPWSTRYMIGDVKTDKNTVSAQLHEIPWYTAQTYKIFGGSTKMIDGTINPNIDRAEFLRQMWQRSPGISPHPQKITWTLKAKVIQ